MLNRNEAFHQKPVLAAVQADVGYFPDSLYHHSRNKHLLLGVFNWNWRFYSGRVAIHKSNYVIVAFWPTGSFEKSMAAQSHKPCGY